MPNAPVLFTKTAPVGTSLDEAARKAALAFEELETEVFEEGIHGGRKFTKADVEEAVKNYNDWGKDFIKSPLVLGHDEKQPLIQNMGMPSLGEMKSCRMVTKPNGSLSVIGKFSDVPKIAVQAIQQRRYRRLSPEIYENYSNPNLDGGKPKGLSFRRISLLGADIPEIKTLADVVALGEDGGLKILFSEPQEDTMTPEQIAQLRKDIAAEMQAEADKRFKAFEEAQKGDIKKLQEENAELKATNVSLAASHAAALLERRSGSIASFIEVQKAGGRILPAWEKAGLKRFMESLDDKKTFKFAEGDKAVEQSPLHFFQDFIKGLPPVVKFGELTETQLELIAKDKQATEATDDLNGALDVAVKKFMEDEKKAGNKTITYSEALREVSIKEPKLVAHLKK